MTNSKSRSGTTWSEADYRAAGYGSIKLRLPREVIEVLGERAGMLGLSRADFLERLVTMRDDAEFKRLRAEFETAREKFDTRLREKVDAKLLQKVDPKLTEKVDMRTLADLDRPRKVEFKYSRPRK